ncbi:MAG: glycosyltransferase [Candidatus Hodarchaeales archaeon]
MDISIVIRCCDDERVFRCIESIDEDVEIIISLCENEVIQKKIEEMKIKYCIIPRGNLSITSNAGFKIASHQKVFITDSDTLFKKNCIRETFINLDKYKIVRARIIFQYNTRNPISKIIAEARDYVNSLPVVYTPGIGVHKDLLDKIGGFLFNDPVPFAVDADLTFRVKEANIPVKYLDSACIYHSSVDIYHDLKAAFRIGKGCAISAILLNKMNKNSKSYRKIRYDLKGVKVTDYPDIVRKKGPLVMLYQIIWDLFFYLGEFVQIHKKSEQT